MKANPLGRKTPASFANSAPSRACDHLGCKGEGLYRAPKSRTQLEEYYWFCLEHVREYNSSWDFFAGMNSAEIEKHLRFDTIWQRTTWPLGRLGSLRQGRIEAEDHFSFFPGEDKPQPAKPKTDNNQDLVLLGLPPQFSKSELKNRYIILVKKYHPDLNQGNKEAEEKLKNIIVAYKRLLQTLEN